MESKKFTLGEALGFGWQKTKDNLLFLASLVLITLFISWLGGYISGTIAKNSGSTVISNIIMLGFNIIGMVITLGITKISLNIVDGKPTSYSDLLSQLDKFWKYLLGTILYSLIVIAGFILLIVPGIIWSIKYQWYSYFIVDKGMSPVEALKESAEITNGIKWDLFILNLSVVLVMLLGILALGIGFLVAMPVTLVATAYVYRKISKSSVATPKEAS